MPQITVTKFLQYVDAFNYCTACDTANHKSCDTPYHDSINSSLEFSELLAEIEISRTRPSQHCNEVTEHSLRATADTIVSSV